MHSTGHLGDVFAFVERLEAAHIHYRFGASRDRMLMVEVNVPGERWEIEFGDDG